MGSIAPPLSPYSHQPAQSSASITAHVLSTKINKRLASMIPQSSWTNRRDAVGMSLCSTLANEWAMNKRIIAPHRCMVKMVCGAENAINRCGQREVSANTAGELGARASRPHQARNTGGLPASSHLRRTCAGKLLTLPGKASMLTVTQSRYGLQKSLPPGLNRSLPPILTNARYAILLPGNALITITV